MNLIARRTSQKRSRRQNRQPQRQNRGGRSRSQLVEIKRLSHQGMPVHKFSRTTNQTFSLTPSTGWNALGFDLAIVFSLSSTAFFVAGALAATASNPGSADFTALFDMYRIDSVEISMMYSVNINSPGIASTAALPIMDIVFDPTDSSTISLSSILQYNNLQVVQLGNQRTPNGYTFRVNPRPLLTATGSNVAAAELNPWISKDTPTVNYLGVKIFYDSAGSTLTTVMGQVNFYVKYNWSMKLSQ